MVILEIYLDVIFLENFLLDYILLLLTGKILRKQKKKLGMIAAAMIGGGYTVLCIAAPIPFAQIINVGILYLMISCAYQNKEGKSVLICMLTMFGISFLAEGVLTWMLENTALELLPQTNLFMLAGAVFFGYLFLENWTERIKEYLFRRKMYVPVSIRMGDSQIHCKGLLDSGNSLYEPVTRRPVVIVEEMLLTKNRIVIPEYFFAIPYHAIGTQNGILKGVLADELEIPEQQGEKRWQNVMLGIYDGKISQKDEYQVILHPKL